jgi:hypothetical protein
MTISTRSYGSVAEVAALTWRYTTAGSFYDTSTGPPATTATKPTLTQIEKWIDNASATLNVMLSNAGFAIPITQADAKSACGQVVVEVVADLVHASNNAGRFYTDRALASGVSPMKVLRREMQEWVDSMKPGLAQLGVAQTQMATMTQTIHNPQLTRIILDDNSDTTDDEIGTLI